jgi:8-amino-7-oxononanoate synthase
MLMRNDDAIRAELERLRRAGLRRQLRPIDGAQDAWITVAGKRALCLSSNNYLGLANHPALVEAAARAGRDLGMGSGASRLISGSMRLHHDLEDALAAFKGTEAALLFSTGYQANIGVISALVGTDDEVFSDELNHASIIDGCRLSRARISVYPHRDTAALEERLTQSTARRRLIVTDSVFSMDGTTAPLRRICELAEQYDAMVMVDEAHATGVVGPQGRGAVAAEGLTERVTVQMGTLGKALGSFGAFVAGSRPLIELLINKARSLIYTTALPASLAAASLEALRLARGADDRRRQLAENAASLAAGLEALGIDLGGRRSHIVPVVIGDADRTMQISERLLDEGVFAHGIRPPTVPEGTARLRVTVMATHTPSDIDHALAAFRRVMMGLRA